MALPEQFTNAAGETAAFSTAGRATAGLALWMATWWMTEAIPISATALLPIAVLPLIGAAGVGEATAPYAHPLIFLFLGGFVLSLAMERWGLHERIALGTLALIGAQPRRIVGGFMVATAGLSMWVSNTATAVMMLPIALSVIDRVARERDAPPDDPDGRAFALCLLLGIAYGASIGGMGTLIGTPPNLVLASFAESQLGRPIGFARWMAVGLPLVVVFLPLVWLLLTRLVFPVRMEALPGGRAFVREALSRLGPVRSPERATAAIFAATAAAWVLRPLLVRIRIGSLEPLAALTDTGIAVTAALVLFLVPARDPRGGAKSTRLMDWPTARRLPWGLLLLFGGGLSLASAIQANGVGEWIGAQVGGLSALHPYLLVTCVTAAVIFLTEITSNTATTAALVPLLASVAPGLGMDPFVLMVPAALAASCAFMLPVATPPNAVVFGSDRIRVAEMCRAGFWLNLLGIVLIPLFGALVALPLLGVSLF
jgi:sodium-dependent dicarboxylate transporter 2/3/5